MHTAHKSGRTGGRISFTFMLILCAALLAFGCGGGGGGGGYGGITNPGDGGNEGNGGNEGDGGNGNIAQKHVVTMSGLSFSPSVLTISLGDTVEWRNNDSMIHTTTSGQNGTPSGMWNSGNMSNGATYTRVFNNTTGSFPYFCIPHWQLGMTGTIIVN